MAASTVIDQCGQMPSRAGDNPRAVTSSVDLDQEHCIERAPGAKTLSSVRLSHDCACAAGDLTLGFALIGNRLHGSSNRVLVPEVVVSDWLKLVIQLINQWLAGRNIEINDILV